MIINVPTPSDFKSNGLAFLNLAWDSILRISKNLKDSEEHLDENDNITSGELEDIRDRYWHQAQPALAIAVALAHQGGEFLLKSRISEVSPFLLISSERWPSDADKNDCSFADFKTVDAQDLIKIHDTVSYSKLSEGFKTRFNELRQLRNTVMHSIDNRNPFTARDGVLAVLEISKTLVEDKVWHELRLEYKQSRINSWDPYNYSEFNPEHPFAMETLHVIDHLLQPAEVMRYYLFDAKQRRYICYYCHEEYAENEVFSCLLTPKGHDTTMLICFCCRRKIRVKRVNCADEDCPGNVIGPDRWEDQFCCLTCGYEYTCDESYSEYVKILSKEEAI